ncbi:MAG: hypothetical protein KF915_09210 [Polyangiaceae bacterium]|nr:hypothetical protein [Polyangiaceae bacterium]
MRGLRKPWPPADVSPEGQETRTWRQAEAEFLEGLGAAADRSAHARAAFDSMEKRKLRAVMYQEQGALCVYCERPVSEGAPLPRIDHWRPLSAEPQLALHWKNLYLSCATEETCDAHKHERPLKGDVTEADLPWPVDHAYERSVGFTSLGEVYVGGDAPLTDPQRRALVHALGAPHDDQVKNSGVLNLNHPKLVAARSAALDSERTRLERQYKGKTATRAEREARKTALLGEHPLQPFVSIRARWLDRSLGKAR